MVSGYRKFVWVLHEIEEYCALPWSLTCCSLSCEIAGISAFTCASAACICSPMVE